MLYEVEVPGPPVTLSLMGNDGGKWFILYHISSVITQSFFFPSKTIQKNLDLSYKTDLDLWDCLGRVNLVL